VLALTVAEVTRHGILGETSVLVDTDGVALVAVVVLGIEVLGVDGTEDIETVTVVGGDDDEGITELTKSLELLHGCSNGVIELQQLTESAVVVECVHLLVDGGGLGHQEPSLSVWVGLVAGAGVENIDGLEGHVLETWLVEGISFATVRGILLVAEVGWVDVAVEPLGHVGDGEDTEGLAAVGAPLERSVVHNNVVASVAEYIVVVLTLVGHATERWRVELLSSTTEENIWTVPLCPSVVGDTVNERVDDCSVLATVSGVSSQSSRSSIGDESGGDDTDVTFEHAVEELGNGLDLWVVELVWARVGVNTESVDGGLVARVQSSGTVGRVGDERVQRMGHAVSKNRELVHGHLGQVLSVGALMSEKTCSLQASVT